MLPPDVGGAGDVIGAGDAVDGAVDVGRGLYTPGFTPAGDDQPPDGDPAAPGGGDGELLAGPGANPGTDTDGGGQGVPGDAAADGPPGNPG